MSYTVKDYRTKKELRTDVENGTPVPVYQPGPFGPVVPDGQTCLEGPHYPKPHTWYATATIRNNLIVSLKK